MKVKRCFDIPIEIAEILLDDMEGEKPMIDKTDCFAYECGTCRILDDADCENCSTYKTWEQTYQEQKKCEKRLKDIARIYQFEYSIPKELLQQFRREEKKNG